MSSLSIRALITLGLCLAVAVIMGYMLAMGRYDSLWQLAVGALLVYLIVSPGYSALLSFGLLCPLTPPVPLVYNFPLLAVVLGLCLLKYMVRRWMVHTSESLPSVRPSLSVALFFGWVVLRYAMDPVIPNLHGFGENVTGFRSYFNFAISLALLLSLSLFLRTRNDLLRLVHWMVAWAACFALIFLVLTVSKSLTAAAVLSRLGVFVTAFDNGWLRFVVLPGFGVILIGATFLPNVLAVRPLVRRLFVVLGVLAVLFGGNRGTFVAALVLVLTIALVKRRVTLVGLVILGALLCLGAFRWAGETLAFKEGFGFLRIMALTSARVAQLTDADANVLWRQMRWDRAMVDIRQKPLLGWGYGGLENAFVFSTQGDYMMASLEWDVASGNIHNGYISGARALGLPGVLIFVAMFLSQIVFNQRRVALFRERDPTISELHTFVVANLVALGVVLYTGAELHSSLIWFYIGLGATTATVKDREPQVEASEVAPSAVDLLPGAVIPG